MNQERNIIALPQERYSMQQYIIVPGLQQHIIPLIPFYAIKRESEKTRKAKEPIIP